MIKETYFENYTLGATRETLGRTITEADIVMHAGQTGDFYPHHMDAEWCKDQPFGQRMAHGTLIFSIAVGMAATEVNPDPELLQISSCRPKSWSRLTTISYNGVLYELDH